MKILDILILCFIVGGCSQPIKSAGQGTYEEDFEALEKVNVSDGVSKAEAHTISKAFFWSKISGCGFPAEPEQVGEYWVSKTFIGYAGLPGEPVFVDRESGEVTWGKRHKVVSLEELRKWKSNHAPQPTQ